MQIYKKGLNQPRKIAIIFKECYDISDVCRFILRIICVNSFNLPADDSDNDAHQRTNQVEETIGKIGESGHAQHRRLRHTAGVPGDEHGGDGGRILGGTAQQPRLVALLAVHIFIHVGIKDDRDELVARGDIEEDACADSRRHQTDTAADETDDDPRDTVDHAAGHHRSAEAHGTEDEPDGVEHARHTTGGDELVERGIACFDGC